MAVERNEGSGAPGAGARNGRVFINEREGRIEFYDSSNRLQRASYGSYDVFYNPETGEEVFRTGDVTDREIADGQFGMVFKDINGNDKSFIGPKAAGIMETYFAGKLQCDITGGTLDGVTYTEYILTIKLFHRFSRYFPDFQPLYDWWGQEKLSGDTEIITKSKTFPQLQTSGAGSSSQQVPFGYTNQKQGELHFKEGATDSDDPTNPNTEYMSWMWNVSNLGGGSVVVAPQTFFLIPHIYYLNQELPVLTADPTYPQGGGGGVLSEELNFYID